MCLELELELEDRGMTDEGRGEFSYLELTSNPFSKMQLREKEKDQRDRKARLSFLKSDYTRCATLD